MNKKVIIILICVCLILVIYFLAQTFILPQTIKKQADLMDKQKEIITIKDILEKTQEYKKIEQEAQKIFSALPDKCDKPELITQFNTIASNNSMILESLNFSGECLPQEKEIGQYPSIMANLTVSGTYQDFKKFLRALEINIRAMDVDVISFNVNPQSKDLVYLVVNLQIKVYYQ